MTMSMRSGQKCSVSRNKAPATKIVFQIFVAGVLFPKVTSVPVVYPVLGGGRERRAHFFFVVGMIYTNERLWINFWLIL